MVNVILSSLLVMPWLIGLAQRMHAVERWFALEAFWPGRLLLVFVPAALVLALLNMLMCTAARDWRILAFSVFNTALATAHLVAYTASGPLP